MEFASPQFWVAALEIIVINILLSGDNAVVIALACRNLPKQQRRWGIAWGAAGAVVLRRIDVYVPVSKRRRHIVLKILAPGIGDPGVSEFAAILAACGGIKEVIRVDVEGNGGGALFC